VWCGSCSLLPSCVDYLCPAGSSHQAGVHRDPSHCSSMAGRHTSGRQQNSQISTVESTHRLPTLRGWERSGILSGEAENVMCVCVCVCVCERERSHLNTVISDWVKSTEEEMLLDSRPIFHCISVKKKKF